ncbi:MAG: hypothetical protein WBL28_09940 [Methylotenera sp.]
MRDILDQIKSASDHGLYHVALISALAVPDICGALESSDGQATGVKYKKWFDQWISLKYGDSTGTSFSGETCYFYRCAVLHQGRASHAKSQFSRVAFLEPNGILSMHDCIINNVLIIDIPTFCDDMIDGAAQWLKQIENNPVFKNNFAHRMQRYPSGIVGVVSDVAVIA